MRLHLSQQTVDQHSLQFHLFVDPRPSISVLTMAQDVNGTADVDSRPIPTDLYNLQLFVYFF